MTCVRVRWKSPVTFKSAPPIPPMIITEVYNALIHLKQIGTRGLDGLDGKILKFSAPVVSDTLTFTIFVYRNVTFRLLSGRPKSFLFLSLERAPSNNRPVSVSKPFGKHINKRILVYFNKNNLLHLNQSGFRENHSCHTALTSLDDQWFSSINDFTKWWCTFCGPC